MRTLALAASLYAAWLLLSGIYTPFLLAAGAGASVAVALLAARMQTARDEPLPWRIFLAPLLYWPWLVVEIVRSGWQVARIVADPRRASPTIVRFRPLQRTTIGLATHANSITLTPGTVTIELADGELVVHALTRSAADALAGGEMDRRVRRLEET